MCLALMAGHPQRFSPGARPAGPSCQATFGHGATTPQHPHHPAGWSPHISARKKIIR